MKRILGIGVFIILGGLFQNCEKITQEEGQNRLPIATNSGKGMFACYIDNETYITKRSRKKAVYNVTTGYLFLENVNSQFAFRLFKYEDVFEEATYAFDHTGEEWASSDYLNYYELDTTSVNDLTITRLDIGKRVVSGIFSFDLIAVGDTIKKQIRNGRFDLEMDIVD